MDYVARRRVDEAKVLLCTENCSVEEAGARVGFALRADKEAIRKELEYKMQPMMQEGGVVFGLDHRIPNGVSWENYNYYVKTARELLGMEARTPERRGWKRMAF